jgi:diguanylate cyclase (GGDEF)-like protein
VAERSGGHRHAGTSSTLVAVPVARFDGTRERAYLVVLAGPQMGAMFKLERGQDLVVGREEGVPILLTDDGVSRRHAQVSLRDGEALVRDLGSRNGLFVNGKQVQEELLADGDKIQLGVTTTIKFTFTDDLEEEYQRRLVEAALRDPLTGLYNRRHFDERLGAELSAARRHGTPLTLMIVDVDHFKNINDTHGHLAGDAVLKQVADVLQAAMRKEDIVARFGGEEFVVIARSTDLEGARRFAERIRGQIEQRVCNFEQLELKVTASIGIAELDADGGAQDLLDAADRALYQAKAGGRNAIVAAGA